MAKTKMRIRFFTIADFKEEQEWLEQEHANGWKLKKVVPPCFFYFEQCSPEKAIYQLDYRNSRITEDYLQIYRDYGWDYIGSCLGWNYFRKEDVKEMNEEDREIFSDKESKIDMLIHIYKTRMVPLLIILILVIIPNLFSNRSDRGTFGVVMNIVWAVLFLLYIYILTYCGIKLSKAKKELEL